MIYLDYAATAPLNPMVLEAMMPYLKEHHGNPSSVHRYGQKAREAIDESRNFFVKVLGAVAARNIIFTGSGSESCNMAIFGAAFARQEQGKHLLLSAIEHPAVMEAAEHLQRAFGFELSLVKPDKEGLIRVEDVEAAIRPDTILISVMLANNEVGTIQPVKKIAKIARERGILMHTDACQAPGFLDINADHLGVDLLSLNGSKVYGPKGIGLLFVREGVQIMPLIFGGGQEFRMRGGTENTVNIVGFAKAMELVLKDSKDEAVRIGNMRDELLDELLKIPGVTINGSRDQRLPNNINLHVEGISGETLVQRLDIEGLATSSGSACASGKTEPSPVLLAMGQSKKKAGESLRITLGRPTTPKEIKAAAKIISSALHKISKS